MVSSIINFDSSHIIVAPFLRREGTISCVLDCKIKIDPSDEMFVYRWDSNARGWKEFYLALHENIKEGILTEEDRLEMLKGLYEKMTDNELRINFCGIALGAIDEIVDDLMNESCEEISGFSKNDKEIKSHLVVHQFFKVKLQMLGIGINE